MKFSTLGVLGLCATLTVVASAQPPGGPLGGAPPGRPGRGGPLMRSAKMRLPRFVEGAARLSGSDALSRRQARRMMSLVSPWRSRPRMSEDQGQTLLASASGVLTSSQRAALQADRPRFGGPRNGGSPRPGGPRPGGGPGGFGGPGGRRDFGGDGQRPSQAQMENLRAMMASFNPLYSGSSAQLSGLPGRMREGMQRQRDRLNSALSQLRQEAR